MSLAKWVGILSTTEPFNRVGLMKVRYANKASEVFEFRITENNKAYDLKGLTVSFCVKPDRKLPVERPATVIDEKNGKIQFIMTKDCMQQAGVNIAYFNLYKGTEFLASTQDFNFTVGWSIDESPYDGPEYIQRLEDFLDYYALVKETLGEDAAFSLAQRVLVVEDTKEEKTVVAQIKLHLETVKADKAPTNEFLNRLQNDKVDTAYFDLIIASLGTGGPRDVFYSIQALKNRYPNGEKGTFLVFDSSFPDSAHSFIWNGSQWVDLGPYQALQIAANSVGTRERTILGDCGFLATQYPTLLNKVTKTLTLPVGFKYIFYRNKIINLGLEKMDIVYSNGVIAYESTNKTFVTGGIATLTEAAIVLGFIYDNTEFINGKVDVVKSNNTDSGFEGVMITNNGSVDIDFEKKQILIPSGPKYVYIKKTYYDLGVDEISVTITGNGLFLYDPETNKLFIGVYSDFKNGLVLLGYIYPNAVILYSSPYRVSGKANLPLRSITKEMLDFDPSGSGGVTSKYYGETIVTFGDSITWYDGKLFNTSHIESGQLVVGYQTHMKNRLGCLIDNRGDSGIDMTQINTKIQNFSFANCKFVTIMSGANDARKGVLVGSIKPIGSVFDTTTYIGAMQASVEKIYSQNKEIQISLLSPIRGWYNEYNTSNVPNPDPNVVGLMSEDYRNGMENVARLYGIAFLDWFNLSGINDLTRTSLIGDKPEIPYYLHPTNLGYERMADILIPFFTNH